MEFILNDSYIINSDYEVLTSTDSGDFEVMLDQEAGLQAVDNILENDTNRSTDRIYKAFKSVHGKLTAEDVFNFLVANA